MMLPSSRHGAAQWGDPPRPPATGREPAGAARRRQAGRQAGRQGAATSPARWQSQPAAHPPGTKISPGSSGNTDPRTVCAARRGISGKGGEGRGGMSPSVRHGSSPAPPPCAGQWVNPGLTQTPGCHLLLQQQSTCRRAPRACIRLSTQSFKKQVPVGLYLWNLSPLLVTLKKQQPIQPADTVHTSIPPSTQCSNSNSNHCSSASQITSPALS